MTRIGTAQVAVGLLRVRPSTTLWQVKRTEYNVLNLLHTTLGVVACQELARSRPLHFSSHRFRSKRLVAPFDELVVQGKESD